MDAVFRCALTPLIRTSPRARLPIRLRVAPICRAAPLVGPIGPIVAIPRRRRRRRLTLLRRLDHLDAAVLLLQEQRELRVALEGDVDGVHGLGIALANQRLESTYIRHNM